LLSLVCAARRAEKGSAWITCPVQMGHRFPGNVDICL
jgi:hypothetical protein